MRRGNFPVTLVVIACAVSPPAGSAQETFARKLARDGLQLELAPLAPDQVRAFFLGRGFASKDAEHLVATGCVFRSAIGSARLMSGDPDVMVALTQWRVTPVGGNASAPRTRED